MNTISNDRSPSLRRPFEGRRIGISASETDSMPRIGLSGDFLNSFTVDLARRLLAMGATIVLGHNWRTGGIMEAIGKFALVYRNQTSRPEQPLIVNYLGAPDQPSLSAAEMQSLQPFVSIETVSWEDRSADLLPLLKQVLPKVDWHDKAQARPRNLLAMRYALTVACDARIIIGGRTKGYAGYAPGIIEELLLSLITQKQILLSTALGGAAEAAANLDSASANEIFKDDSHPLARDALTTANYYISKRGTVKVTDKLHTDALLPALARMMH